MKHIVALAKGDAFLRVLSNYLGAVDTLRSEPCGSDFCDADVDPSLSQSRKALVCLEEVGVHTVGKELNTYQYRGDVALMLVNALG